MKLPTGATVGLALMTIILCPSPTLAQTDKSNLLESFDPIKHVVKGDWQSSKAGLQIKAAKGAVCRLPGTVGEAFQLTVEFTRTKGGDTVAFIVPIGGKSVAVELSSWQGEAHGMARVNGQTSRSQQNPTTVRPGTLTNGKRYRVDIDVASKAGNPSISVQLDRKQLFAWSGDASSLQPHFAFNLPDKNAIGLATSDNDVTFHRVQLTSPNADKNKSAASTKPDKPESPNAVEPATDDSITLATLGTANTPGWEPFNGARFAASKADKQADVEAVTNAGSGDRGAYLKGVTFSEGNIEVDLKGSNQRGQSFVGVVFHGVDGDTYDAVYFRPFNFKASNNTNRIHAVQYIAHPDWPWQRLRSERNGEYEKQANPEPNADEWFHARIDVKGKRVRVYVNNSKTPCLDIEKLNSRKSGKVGLWFNGIASFANLKITQAK